MCSLKLIVKLFHQPGAIDMTKWGRGGRLAFLAQESSVQISHKAKDKSLQKASKHQDCISSYTAAFFNL